MAIVLKKPSSVSNNKSPRLQKAALISGANIFLKNVTLEDAEFILSLRLDPEKNKYLSRTSQSLEDQIAWLKKYEKETDQAYFIICDKSMKKLGCIRMYDPIDSSYCWGSWLMISGLSPLVSIESVLLIYAYGKNLGFTEARIDVRKDNISVWKFHETIFSATRIQETDDDYFYIVTQKSIDAALKKFSKLITLPLLKIKGDLNGI